MYVMIIATPIVKAIDETDYVIEWPQMLSDAIRTYHYVNIYIEIREQKKEKLNYWKHIMITNLLVHSSSRKWLYSLPFYFFIVLLIVKVIKFKKQSIFVYIILYRYLWFRVLWIWYLYINTKSYFAILLSMSKWF